MPLKKTKYSVGECPLGMFRFDPKTNNYAVSPPERSPYDKCMACNFGDINQPKFDLDRMCQCPPDMTHEEYDRLVISYLSADKHAEHTRPGLWDFVKANYNPKK